MGYYPCGCQYGTCPERDGLRMIALFSYDPKKEEWIFGGFRTSMTPEEYDALREPLEAMNGLGTFWAIPLPVEPPSPEDFGDEGCKTRILVVVNEAHAGPPHLIDLYYAAGAADEDIMADIGDEL